MVERWIGWFRGRAKRSFETQTEVAADAHRTDLHHFTFDLRETLRDRLCLRFDRGRWRRRRRFFDSCDRRVRWDIEFCQQRLNCRLLFGERLLQLVELAILSLQFAFE